MIDREQSLGELIQPLERRLRQLDDADVIRRIWRLDHTVWRDDPTEITQPNRLGWLDVPVRMLDEAPTLERFAAEAVAQGIQDVVLLGMGGSSLAPEVMASVLPRRDGYPTLHVLDTTVPADIIAVESRIERPKTLFVVASKSGTTVETASQLAYFWQKLPQGRNFVAITDPATVLATLGAERCFRHVFLNPPEIGGRYSSLSYFGLVPAALAGADLRALLEAAMREADACRATEAASNPGAVLGALIGEAALQGRDKLTLVLPDELSSFGDWAEQLVAESTGKEGKGIVPLVGERLGTPEVYGNDRIFITYGDAPGLAAIEAAGQPVLRLEFERLGAEFYRWEFAAAVAGHVLQINPFDQPDVESAKQAAQRFIETSRRTEIDPSDLHETLGSVRPGDYIALQAYLPRRRDDVRARLEAARLRLRDRYRVATTLGFGPRYLHSTGQLHKGGPATGVFIQLEGHDDVDLPIPGRPLTFGALKHAQALGDFDTLRSSGRRAVRTTLEELEAALGED